LTNAAGALNASLSVGSFMWVSDHLNMTGTNPLLGVRKNPFIDLSHLYKNQLFAELKRQGERNGLVLNKGVLAGVLGPSYETPAEVRVFRALGADAVSMSTVNETIMAKYLGLEVAGLSFLANAAAGMGEIPLDHSDVLKAGQTGVEQLLSFLPGLLDIWS